ncbi:MAG: hypothetical protein QOJ34_2376 [Pseudonocardiales bacterium]|nr:hypothetical protein [Pseudonocardiales bacterium]
MFAAEGSPAPQLAMVTGAGRGIGRAIALALAGAGHPLVLVARNADQLAQTQALVASVGASVVSIAADVGSWESVRGLADRVLAEIGPVHVLVNNAGYAPPEVPFLASDVGDWERTITVNLLAPMWLCRAFVPGMAERGGGVVINMNSLGGCQPFPTQSAYAASKAGLCRLTDTLAAELAGVVQFFDVHPGLVRTSMTENLQMWKGLSADRWTAPTVVADVVVQLATGRHSALSGRFINASTDRDLGALARGLADEQSRTLRLVPSAHDG